VCVCVYCTGLILQIGYYSGNNKIPQKFDKNVTSNVARPGTNLTHKFKTSVEMTKALAREY
jgi:hypothetical protein